MPIIGQYQISDIARVSYILHERWGRIVRLGGLLGRPDLLFVYDADEIEKVIKLYILFYVRIDRRCGYSYITICLFIIKLMKINLSENKPKADRKYYADATWMQMERIVK